MKNQDKKKCYWLDKNGICSLFTEDSYISGTDDSGVCQIDDIDFIPERDCETFKGEQNDF